jgi:type IV secretion system protein VirB6
MVLVAMLVFLLLRQVMPIASALAGGIALSTFGIASGFVRWGMRQGTAAGRGAVALTGGALSAPAPATARLTVERARWDLS